MNYCFRLNILWFLVPNTQQGWIILKKLLIYFLPLKSSDPSDVSLFPLVLYTPYQLKSIALGNKKGTVKKMWPGQASMWLSDEWSVQSCLQKDNFRRICGKGFIESEQINEELLGSSPTCKSCGCLTVTKWEIIGKRNSFHSVNFISTVTLDKKSGQA